MKKIFLVITFLLLSTSAQAVDLTFIWDYPTPPFDLAGFRLYQDNEMIKNDIDKTARTVTASIPDLGDGNTCFHLTAFDLADHESDPSERACVDPAPGAPSNFSVQVKVTVEVSPSAGVKK